MGSEGWGPRPGGTGTRVQKGTVYNGRGQAIRYWLCGESGPALVLCNGLAGGIRPWEPVLRHFVGRCRVLLWEYPGQGASRDAAPAGDRGPKGLAGDAVRLLEGAGIQQAVLAGQGMGVQVALEAFRLRPEWVVCMVCICGVQAGILSALLPSPLDRAAARTVDALLLRPAGLPALKVLRAFRAAALPPSSEACPASGQRDEVFGGGAGGWLDAVTRSEPRTGLRLLAGMLFHHPRPDLRRERLPLLILAGERDRLASPKRARRMGARLGASRVEVLAGCSHRALAEDPASICRHMESFLREQGIV